MQCSQPYLSQDAANGMRLINAAMANNVNEIMNLVSKKKTNVNFKNSVSVQSKPLMLAAYSSIICVVYSWARRR